MNPDNVLAIKSRILCTEMNKFMGLRRLEIMDLNTHRRELEKQRVEMRKITAMGNKVARLMMGSRKRRQFPKLLKASSFCRLMRKGMWRQSQKMKVTNATTYCRASRNRGTDYTSTIRAIRAELFAMQTIVVTGPISLDVVEGLVRRGWGGRVLNRGMSAAVVEKINDWAVRYNIELVR